MPDLVLSLDVGTQSVRSILFGPRGEVHGSCKIPIEPYTSPQPGWAEQDPEYFWQKLAESTRRLFAESEVDRSALRCVTLTTQRSTVVNVNTQGKPIRPAFVWPDQRRTVDVRPVGGLYGLGFKLIGMEQAVRYAQKEAEINWLLKNQPEIVDTSHKMLYLSGYLTFRLTGLYRDSAACQVGFFPFDFKRFQWCQPGDWKWTAFPIPADKLPELVQPAQTIGEISKAASADSHIPAGLPLIAAAADKACELLGAGCLAPNVAGLSFGTTATVGTNSRRYVEVIPFIPPYPSAVPGMYSTEIQIYRGFWLVTWFRREFGMKEEMEAQERGVEPESLLDRLLDEVPPGSLGLTLQPYWSPGVKTPGPEAKGSIIGFGGAHTRAHVYRAIIEGLCYALRDGAEATQRRTWHRFRELRVSGGGSQSDHALQITADIFDLPVVRPRLYETASLGAAMDGAVGSGLHPDFESAVKDMTGSERTFEPRKAEVRIYGELYHQVYKSMYRRMQPLFRRIKRITGYPD